MVCPTTRCAYSLGTRCGPERNYHPSLVAGRISWTLFRVTTIIDSWAYTTARLSDDRESRKFTIWSHEVIIRQKNIILGSLMSIYTTTS
jgi:hypothetical protein